VSGGNELLDGNILVFVKRNGRQMTPVIYRYHPEIEDAGEMIFEHVHCDELQEAGEEQLIFTNFTCASLMLNAFYTVLNSKLEYAEVFFDIISNTVRPIARK
jgi:hypothetical protein